MSVANVESVSVLPKRKLTFYMKNGQVITMASVSSKFASEVLAIFRQDMAMNLSTSDGLTGTVYFKTGNVATIVERILEEELIPEIPTPEV